MKVRDLLSAESVIYPIRATSKKQVLEELASHAANISGHNQRSIFDVILERERLGTTGIGRGVAIPHGKLPDLNRLYGVFGKLEKPVNFEAVDHQNIDLIFLLIAPESSGADHLQALSKISRLFRDSDICKKLRATNDHNLLHKLLLDQAEPSSI